MPYWGIKALLQLDILLRTPQMLRLAPCRPHRGPPSPPTGASLWPGLRPNRNLW
jgi:hypothetical protein